MNSCYFTLFIFAAITFLLCLNLTGATTCHPDDEAGLLSFKSGITKDPSGILNSWKKGTACCSWNGVTCNNNGRVVLLIVSGNPKVPKYFLSGTISPMLAKLHHVEAMLLFDLRNITGPFPLFLQQLPKLTDVNIGNNRLSGPLPTNIGALSKLERFNIEGNRFTGQIPNSISNLTRLSEFIFSDNLLTGTIPSGVANLKNLAYLDLSGNHLFGTIPDIFKSMKRLQTLDLSRNRFSGKLPPSISSLAPTLMILQLGQNNLSGTIPSFLSRFKTLVTLDLSKNQYSGVVPMSFTNLVNITKLDLSHNLLTDPFPTLHPKSIEYLDLSYNKFHLKIIPTWVTSAPTVYTLKLAKCGIEMSLDDWKPLYPAYYNYIDLSENEISGSPEQIMNDMLFLMEFQASNNKLRCDIENLNFVNSEHSLRILDLSRNLIFGKVPASVARLKNLNLSQNHLCGKLPATTFPASAFAGNDCLCGSPLSPCKSYGQEN